VNGELKLGSSGHKDGAGPGGPWSGVCIRDGSLKLNIFVLGHFKMKSILNAQRLKISTAATMAASAPPPTYPYKIQSLLQANPTLPVLGVLDVDREIIANTPIDPTNLTNAKVVATKLKATLGKSSMTTNLSDILMAAIQSPRLILE
jgi:hypothetical protein